MNGANVLCTESFAFHPFAEMSPMQPKPIVDAFGLRFRVTVPIDTDGFSLEAESD
jgi:hypothetical protein